MNCGLLIQMFLIVVWYEFHFRDIVRHAHALGAAKNYCHVYVTNFLGTFVQNIHQIMCLQLCGITDLGRIVQNRRSGQTRGGGDQHYKSFSALITYLRLPVTVKTFKQYTAFMAAFAQYICAA